MVRAIGRILLSMFGVSLVVLPVFDNERASAQDCSINTPCELFEEDPAFPTGDVRSTLDATDFGVTRKQVTFDRAQQTAHIAGGSTLRTPILIDDFLTINGRCPGAFDSICGANCFGEVLRPDLVEDVTAGQNERDIFINEIFRVIPPVDVSHLIPTGTTEVRFTLCDSGGLAGNTNLFLVISQRPEPPRITREQCLAAADEQVAEVIRSCAQRFSLCPTAPIEPADCEAFALSLEEAVASEQRPECICNIGRITCLREGDEFVASLRASCPAE